MKIEKLSLGYTRFFTCLVRTTALLARRGVFVASLALMLIESGSVLSIARSAPMLTRSTPHIPSALAASSASVKENIARYSCSIHLFPRFTVPLTFPLNTIQLGYGYDSIVSAI